MVEKPVLLNEYAAAEYIGMSVAYLRADRQHGAIGGRTPGPTFLRMGGRTIRYRRDDLDAWLKACRVDRASRKRTTAQPAA